MKKTILIMAACMLVFAFVGVASAEILKCETAVHHINRGCETIVVNDQAPDVCTTSPFDYEDFYGANWGCIKSSDIKSKSYCETPGKDDLHRALFKICDCIDDGYFGVTDVDPGDTIDIGMEILVDKKDGNGAKSGNNGVYWAQDVNSTGSWGVGVEPFANQGAACADTKCTPASKFVGDFDYWLGDGTMATALPYTGTLCDVPASQEITKFQASTTQTGNHGYVIQPTDATDNKSVWWVDIPMLRVDRTFDDMKGWDVYVKICMYNSLDTGGVCGDCEGCCYNILIGTLCCEDAVVPPTTCADKLTFPYFPKTESYWYGMAVTNLSGTDGEATVTLYEADGDVFTGTVDVDANSTYVIDTTADLALTTTGADSDGILGDDRSYAKVVTDFSAAGFAMMAKGGTSMGYLAERCSGCATCP